MQRAEILKKQWSPKNEKAFQCYSTGSHYRAWWICSQGHEWQAVAKSRYAGCNCPYCSGRMAVPGKTDLQTLYPDIAKEWHPQKNMPLLPTHVTAQSNRRVWWQCKNEHEWKANVSGRTNGKGCPYCNHKLASEENNFAVIFPEKLKLWDWDKNTVSPYSLLPHSNKIAWWVCEKGHHWSAAVNIVVKKQKTSGCPYCAGKRVIQGISDLQTTDPEIASEWDYQKNVLMPSEVSRCSHKKFFWICPRGHSYKAEVANRVAGKGCSICAGKKKGTK